MIAFNDFGTETINCTCANNTTGIRCWAVFHKPKFGTVIEEPRNRHERRKLISKRRKNNATQNFNAKNSRKIN